MQKLVVAMGLRLELSEKLLASDRHLPLNAKNEAKLKALLPEGTFTYLILEDCRSYEIVRVDGTCSGLVVTRAQDGTEARTFPCGTCARFDITPEAIKYMICNETCVDCDCTPVAFAGSHIPPIKPGQEWNGSVMFTGDTPMAIAVSQAPAWMKVVVGVNYVSLSGVPTSPASMVFSVAATNCGGEVETVALELK